MMQCLAPTVLYTDVDGQCDKLVTDDTDCPPKLTAPEIWLVPTKI